MASIPIAWRKRFEIKSDQLFFGWPFSTWKRFRFTHWFVFLRAMREKNRVANIGGAGKATAMKCIEEDKERRRTSRALKCQGENWSDIQTWRRMRRNKKAISICHFRFHLGHFMTFSNWDFAVVIHVPKVWWTFSLHSPLSYFCCDRSARRHSTLERKLKENNETRCATNFSICLHDFSLAFVIGMTWKKHFNLEWALPRPW